MNIKYHCITGLAAFLLLGGSCAALADTTDNGRFQPALTPQAPPKARPFSLQDVKLLDGFFLDGQKVSAEYLLSLEPDRFLAQFHSNAGLEPKAKRYEGWESMSIAGHSCGHYLSACALAYASTGNPEFLKRVNYIVSEFTECQKAKNSGLISAIPGGEKCMDELRSGVVRSEGFNLNGIWVPFYTYHKQLAGLRDAYRICGNREALEVAQKFADYLWDAVKGLDEEKMQRVLFCEHGGMNEVLADLYADTGEVRYFSAARRFHHRAILDPLIEGRDILPGKHANTQVPKLVGLATLYEITGNPADRDGADYFWERVVHHHSYVTGGHCDREHFSQPDKLNDRLSQDTTETCNVNNMLKLTRHVFGWRPEAKVGDFFERALYNHILSSHSPEGRVIYNLSLKQGGHKVYQRPYDDFTCCVGTGFENHVKYCDGIYFHNESNLWVNLFIASELNWEAKGIRLTQETRYPDESTSRITLSCKKPEAFTLQIRHPGWASDGAFVKVNGVVAKASWQPASFIKLDRQWKDGDVIEIEIPMKLRKESMPDNPNRIAVFYGPILLAAQLGEVEDPSQIQEGFVPILRMNEKVPLCKWIKPIQDRSLTFRTEGVGYPRDVELVPFFRLHGSEKYYTVYLDVYTEEQYHELKERIEAEKAAKALLEKRTVDLFFIGQMQPERDHNLTGEKTSVGEHQGRKWRHAASDGWFAFDMKVDPEVENILTCTYWGGDHRTFEIQVDGEVLARQELTGQPANRFIDVEYKLPFKFTQNKNRVNIKFIPVGNSYAGGLFGVRMLRE
ncbi:MAG TPA: glycoside hydrolase family 127 protein [Verrucomicrobiota bacterium]|nr:glycoside hydrolase family 127 protein [Verrucomicrobiota bacterium]